MVIVVRPAASRSNASCTARSVRVSSALVASSRMSTVGLRSRVRAMAMRCFSPPEKRWPREPTMVSYPSGSARMALWICASLAACSISASVAPGLAYRRFSRTVVCSR